MMTCYGATAFTLAIISFLTCVVSFVTPYWLVSWEQKQSTFSKIGLWEVCFTAFSDPKLHAYKYYSGCWWIFHHEVDAIRPMLNPAWFQAVQSFAILALLSSIVCAITSLVGRCTNRNWCMSVNAVFFFITALFAGLCVIIFGSCAKDPRMYRLPMPQYNYFSGGFAMIILTTLASGFGMAFAIGASQQKSIDDIKRR